MRKVVLFKSASDEYTKAFGEKEYDVIFVEPLQFEWCNAEALGAALAREAAALLLTSPRAVEAVARRWDPAKFVAWGARRLYAVGEATARHAKLLLGLDARGAAAGSARSLAHVILEENPPGSTFIFPCGNLSSEALPSILEAQGMIVETLTVYETKESEKLRQDLMELNSSAEEPCCMVFFSPSGCEYIHRQLQTFSNRLYHLPHFAIGNSTAHKIENLGIEIAGVAARPRPDCVSDSVHQYFSARPSPSPSPPPPPQPGS